MGFCDENNDGSIDCRECIRASAKIVLLIINTVWLLIALGLLSGGVYALIYLKDFEALIEPGGIYATIIVGVCALFVCIVGYCGICKLSKKLLFIYSIFLFVLSVAQFAAGAAVLSYTNTLQNVDSSVGNSQVDAAQKDSTEFIDNYLNCTYNVCCNITKAEEMICSKKKSGRIQGGTCVGLKASDLQNCESGDKFRKTIIDFLLEYSTSLYSGIFGAAGGQFVGFIIACCFVMTAVDRGDKVDYEV